MAQEWEQYADRYTQRPETFDAYIEVWTHHPRAKDEFGVWATFSQCANAEPKQVRDAPDRVEMAKELMEHSGYVIGTPTERGARRWWRSPAV